MARILLVETDRLLAQYYQKMLTESTDHRIFWARSAQAAINILDKKKIDLVISEMVLDRHNGVELLHELRSYEDWIKVPIIFISSIEESRIPIRRALWNDYGIKEFLLKSQLGDPRLLAKTVRSVLA